MQNTRVAVLGGGALGLTVAMRLARRGAQVTVIEKEGELGGLAAGFRVAFGSSGPPENVLFHVDLLGVASRLDAVITGADVTRGKPDPQVFLMAAERMGVPPAQCVVIEDAAAGVEAANRAGMTSIALVGTTTRGKLSHAKLVVDSLSELNPERIAALIAMG